MASSDYTGSQADESDVSPSDAAEEASDAESSSLPGSAPRDDSAENESIADSGVDEPSPASQSESESGERPHEIQAGAASPSPNDTSGADASGADASGTDASGADASSEAPSDSPSPPLAARIPEPLSPAEGGEVDEPSVTFEWERVTEADNYELQVARDRTFDQLVFEGRVGSSSRFTYSGLPPQEGLTLYWRVRAHVDGIGWTDFGTIGTFVLADWRPNQPNLATSSGSAPAAQAQSSRAEPVLIVFSIVITTVAIGLSIIYMQDLSPGEGDETTAETTEAAEADTANLDALQPRDDGTYRIPINTAMQRVVEQTGGTWDDGADEQPGTGEPDATPEDAQDDPRSATDE